MSLLTYHPKLITALMPKVLSPDVFAWVFVLHLDGLILDMSALQWLRHCCWNLNICNFGHYLGMSCGISGSTPLSSSNPGALSDLCSQWSLMTGSLCQNISNIDHHLEISCDISGASPLLSSNPGALSDLCTHWFPVNGSLYIHQARVARSMVSTNQR